MELEHFIESDMRFFLENRRAVEATPVQSTPRKEGILTPEEIAIYSLGRDYVTEMEKWLADRNFAKAKQTLLDLKDAIALYPADAPELVEGRRLFQSIYARFQQALADERKREDALPAASAPAQPQPGAPVPAPAPGLTEEEEHALMTDIEQLRQLIFENAFGAAVHAYQELRRNPLLEYMSPQQRARILPHLRSLYLLLHERLVAAPQAVLNKEFGKEMGVDFSAAGSAQDAKRSDELDKALLGSGAKESLKPLLSREIVDDEIATKELVSRGKRSEAMSCYNQMRDKILRLEGQQRDEGFARLANLYSLIAMMKVTAEDAPLPSQSKTAPIVEREERRLTGTP